MESQTRPTTRFSSGLAGAAWGSCTGPEIPRLAPYVALKVLRPDTTADPRRKDRLTKEARSASALNHPNIVTIYDVNAANGVDFIAMEYVEGKPLASLIAGGPPPLDAALKYAVQTASALAAAHEAGIVHRDVKPANVMVPARAT